MAPRCFWVCHHVSTLLYSHAKRSHAKRYLMLHSANTKTLLKSWSATALLAIVRNAVGQGSTGNALSANGSIGMENTRGNVMESSHQAPICKHLREIIMTKIMEGLKKQLERLSEGPLTVCEA